MNSINTVKPLPYKTHTKRFLCTYQRWSFDWLHIYIVFHFIICEFLVLVDLENLNPITINSQTEEEEEKNKIFKPNSWLMPICAFSSTSLSVSVGFLAKFRDRCDHHRSEMECQHTHTHTNTQRKRDSGKHTRERQHGNILPIQIPHSIPMDFNFDTVWMFIVFYLNFLAHMICVSTVNCFRVLRFPFDLAP